jgi:virulence factor Mce-like protein
MKRRPRYKYSNARAHHAVIGTLAILAALAVAVISYRANAGLPFQSSYRVYVDVPNANGLYRYTDVRIGGIRVGQVQSLGAIPGGGRARSFSRLQLSLNPSVGRIPMDSRVEVRVASVLGSSYVALTLGRSSRKLAPGATLPLSQANTPVQLTDLLNAFDRSSANSIQEVLRGTGYGLAGRGNDVNATIGSLAGLARPLTRVLGAVASPRADLPRFMRGYDSAAHALAPVSGQLGALVADTASTFGALDVARTPLGQTIEAFPPTAATTTRALVNLQPAFTGLARLARELRPGADLLPSALPVLDGTLAAGIAPLRRLPALGAQLRTGLRVLAAVGRDPAAAGALRKLTDASTALGALLDAVVPAQLQCNIFGIFGQNLSSALAGAGLPGTPLAQVGGTTVGAVNELFQNASPSSNMHTDAAPIESYQQCQAGNEPYNPNVQRLSNPTGVLSNQTEATYPPPGVTALAAKAGLLNTPRGTP